MTRPVIAEKPPQALSVSIDVCRRSFGFKLLSLLIAIESPSSFLPVDFHMMIECEL